MNDMSSMVAAQRPVRERTFRTHDGVDLLCRPIDALYGLSLLVCVTRAPNSMPTRSGCLTAQLVAVACVVAAPHRLSFDRPAADGLFGAMFDALAGFDLPYNQVPSLHIALAVILWGYTPARFAAWRAFCSTSGSC